tara:strand:+ start:305 stop:676 length:372 start_codon:yes stop_codon:yes gene_type:complete
MRTGLVIYASSIGRLAEFYSHVFGLDVVESDSSYMLLVDGDFELVLLETEISKTALNSHEVRENTPLKPTFFVDTRLELIGEKVKEKGGTIYPPKSWEFGGRQVCDACDCEGNIFQLRVGKNA